MLQNAGKTPIKGYGRTSSALTILPADMRGSEVSFLCVATATFLPLGMSSDQ